MQKDLHPEIARYTRAHPAFLALVSRTGQGAAPRGDRMSVFFAVIQDMPIASGMMQAKLFVDSVLNCIEDEFSCVPFDPPKYMSDGRLYPADEDFRRKFPTSEVAWYQHKAHSSFFGANGSFRISERLTATPRILVDRPGSNGKTIGDLLELHSRTLRPSGS